MDAELQELGRRLVGHWTTEATHPEDQTMSGKGQLSYDDVIWDDDLEITYRRAS